MLNGILLEALQRGIHQLLQYEDKDLVQRPEWRNITFESVESKIVQAIDIARKLSELDLKYIPEIYAGKIIRSCNKVAGLLTSVDLLDVTEYDNPSEVQNTYCKDIVSSVDELTRNTKLRLLISRFNAETWNLN